MSKKERDIWDDAVRSKLDDFEVDPFPGDWEAIADRLPGKAPIPLRRTLRYWAAAAVASLLIVSGGVYWYEQSAGKPMVVQESSGPEMSEDFLPLLAQTDSVETLSDVDSSQPIVRKTVRSVSFAAVPGKEHLVSHVVYRSARGCQRDLPVDTLSQEPAVTLATKANESDEVADVRVAVTSDYSLLANVTPDKKHVSVSSKPARRWGFGMGGGGLTLGANHLVPQYVTNSSLFKSENLMSLNALDVPKNAPAKTDIRHKTPIGIGLSVSYYLNNRFALQTGLNYSYLRSEWTTNNTYHIDNDQRLHFIGIPLSLAYKIAEWNRFLFYASAGGMAEVNVAGKRLMTLYSDNVKITSQREHVRMKEWLWSVHVRGGVSYPIIRFISAFAEVGASYYFDNGSAIETIHSEKPFNVNLQLGFRFGF